jgi:hypothetical protein
MDGIAQRFLDSGNFGTYFIQIRFPQFFGREFYIVSKTAIGGDTNDEVVGTDVRIADLALMTLPTKNM